MIEMIITSEDEVIRSYIGLPRESAIMFWHVAYIKGQLGREGVLIERPLDIC